MSSQPPCSSRNVDSYEQPIFRSRVFTTFTIQLPRQGGKVSCALCAFYLAPCQGSYLPQHPLYHTVSRVYWIHRQWLFTRNTGFTFRTREITEAKSPFHPPFLRGLASWRSRLAKLPFLGHACSLLHSSSSHESLGSLRNSPACSPGHSVFCQGPSPFWPRDPSGRSWGVVTPRELSRTQKFQVCSGILEAAATF